MTKPVNPLTLKNRVHVHLTLKFQTDRLRELALLDGLTGIANRRHFEQRLVAELARARRADSAPSLVLIDVDYFTFITIAMATRPAMIVYESSHPP